MTTMPDIKEIAREILEVYNVKLSPEGFRNFASILKPMKLTRSQRPFPKGEVCPCIYYVKRGLVLQHYEKNGVDVVEHISHEGDMVICIESFFLQQPSRIEVTPLEYCILYGIPYDEMHALARTSYEICQFMFAILERSLIISQQKADMLRFETAKQRYVRTLKENPELVRRTPVHYLASLLQMKPETMSRVRTQVMMEGV